MRCRWWPATMRCRKMVMVVRRCHKDGVMPLQGEGWVAAMPLSSACSVRPLGGGDGVVMGGVIHVKSWLRCSARQCDGACVRRGGGSWGTSGRLGAAPCVHEHDNGQSMVKLVVCRHVSCSPKARYDDPAVMRIAVVVYQRQAP